VLHQITSYLKFLVKSSNQHGVHSPFVFDLVTKCFYDRNNFAAFSKLSAYKDKLLKDKTSLDILDLGPGSRINKNNKRLVSEIAKNAGSTKKRAQLLYRLSKYFKFEKSLELGTSLGIATYAIHLGNENSKITTIEGCPNLSSFTTSHLKEHNAKNINLLNGDFSEVISTLNEVFDFIYIDGNHTKEATLDYFNQLLKHAHNDTVFLFDDIYWSKEMTEAWQLLKSHPKVTVTIDCFWCGFVFIRQEQAKEHFTIRL
jgi:predicted O-methyltransferase YrrM